MTNFGPFEKIVDLSVCRRVERSRYLNEKVHNCRPFCIRHVAQRSRSHKTSQKGLKNIQKSIAELSHLAAAATRQIIVPHATYQILDLFGLSKFKGGNAPLAPLIKISLYCPLLLGETFHKSVAASYIKTTRR